MKKLIVMMCISVLLISCGDKSIEDARMVRVGMSTVNLIEIMGEPWDVEVSQDKEVWRFSYFPDGMFARRNILRVTIVNNKIKKFETW